MGVLTKVNWRNPFNVFALFGGLALVFLIAFVVLRHFHTDPPQPVTVELKPEQVRTIQEPLKSFFQSLYDSNAARRRAESDSATMALQAYVNAHLLFLSQQPDRDEKYNSALTAADSTLFRLWSERYDR